MATFLLTSLQGDPFLSPTGRCTKNKIKQDVLYKMNWIKVSGYRIVNQLLQFLKINQKQDKLIILMWNKVRQPKPEAQEQEEVSGGKSGLAVPNHSSKKFKPNRINHYL